MLFYLSDGEKPRKLQRGENFYQHPSPPNQAEEAENTPVSRKGPPRSAKPAQMNRKTRPSPKEKSKIRVLDF